MTSADNNATDHVATGALTSDVTVPIALGTGTAPPGASSPVYSVSITDTNLNPVDHFAIEPTLTIHFDPALGTPQLELVGAAGDLTAQQSVVDVSAHTITAELHHFSSYVLATDLQSGCRPCR